ncbi:sensor histidine kinase [Marinibacterium profundimaris]|uniref:sensor histidine kinase n=1 Tax=Marinibacterium profundimaris TaxID=1679460 RepID=UPI000B52152A|nr:ATP-binding protein [Marinibacterium profundimaris]
MGGMLHRVTLRFRILAVIVALACGSVMVLAGLHQLGFRTWLQAESLARLELTGTLYAEGVGAVFDMMQEDAAENARFPSVGAIVRAYAEAGGMDPAMGGDATAQSEERLAAVFAVFLRTRPHYTQIRLIGRADDWRELVRVDRGPDGPQIMPAEMLQSKGHRDYLDGIARMGVRSSYFSNVDYNLDFGESDGTVTIRVVQPVLDDAGDLFGAIVINADYEAMLQGAAPDLPKGLAVTIIDHDGAYMTFSDDRPPPVLRFRDDPGWTLPRDWELANQRPGEQRSGIVGDQAYASVPILREKAGSPHWLNVVTRMPAAALFAPARQQLLRDGATSLALLLVVGLLAVLFARRLTRPLTALDKAVRARGSRGERIDYEIRSEDEVGTLARSFMEMTDDLIRESARLEALLNSASEGIIIIGADGIISEVNPALARMFRHDRDDLVGAPLTMLMPPEERADHQSHVAQAAALGRAPAMKPLRVVWGQRKDGSRFPLEVSLGRARYDGQVHFIGVVHDNSFKHEVERQREVLIDALQRSNTELDQFAYVASHDLRAPLRVIDNASRWLEEDLEPHLTEDTRESLDMLRNRVQRMERLLDDLLEHSRIGRVDTPAVMVRGDRMMEDLRALVAIPEGFTLEVSPAFADIELPSAPIETVLLNLVSNAFKHHDRDTGLVRVEVEQRPGAFVFRVEDDGPGIPEEFQSKVFELFQTLRPRDQVESSGMGLAMVRKYVDLAGGEISIRSDGERGTTFVLIWPRTNLTVKEAAA